PHRPDHRRGDRGRRERRDQADHQALLVALDDDDVRAVRARQSRRPGAPGRRGVQSRRDHVHGGWLPDGRSVPRRVHRRDHRRYRHLHRRRHRRDGDPRLTSETSPATRPRAAARRYGTPAFVTDLATLGAACRDVVTAFPDPVLRQYSVKANDAPAVIPAVTTNGFGANVVSRGEWAQASRAGVPNARTTLEGVGKTTADLAAAARAARRH